MSSKIKVDTIENVAGSGNVSLGSGHNLVVPGNITGQGTLGVTGATTTAGITSSAAHTVTTSTHANASVFKSTGNTQIMLQDTDASANDQFWGLQVSGGSFNIITCNDDRASGFVTPMEITSAGHVKKPLQPSFSIRHFNVSASSSNRTIGNTGEGGSVTVFSNVGSHFNNSNGRFTAPVAGLYLFTVGFYMRAQNGGNSTQFILAINGTEVNISNHMLLFSVYAVEGLQPNASQILDLSANDVVTVHRRTAGQTGTSRVYMPHSYFQGCLIG